jgi:AraC-like DNA-binding protein
VYHFIAYVEEHYHEDLHMEQLEKDLYTSKTYLSRVFKEVTGISPFKYIYQRRINQAKLIFLLEECSVTDVCFRVGFKHLAHFSRLFKDLAGCTPEQFKKAKTSK